MQGGPLVLGLENPLNLKPRLLETVYGVDCAVPTGLGRLVAWYAPQRGEGMLEFRVDA